MSFRGKWWEVRGLDGDLMGNMIRTWKHFLHSWALVDYITRWFVTLMFSLLFPWVSVWASSWVAGVFRRRDAYCINMRNACWFLATFIILWHSGRNKLFPQRNENIGGCKQYLLRTCWNNIYINVYIYNYPCFSLNTLRPGRLNGRDFPDDIFKCIFLNENV